MKTNFYYKKDAAELTGLSPRKIQFYTEEVGIIPEIKIPTDRGSNRKYSRVNLIEFLLIKELSSMGLRLDIIKDIMESVRKSRKKKHQWWTERVEENKTGDFFETMWCFVDDPFSSNRKIRFMNKQIGGGHRWDADHKPRDLPEYMNESEGVRMNIVLNIGRILEETLKKSTI